MTINFTKITAAAFLAILVLIGIYLVFKPQSIAVKGIGNGSTADVMYVGPEKYYDSFAKSLKRAEDSAGPFRQAGVLMESGRYEEALKALDESLEKSSHSIEKTMVYLRRQEIYQKTGNLEKELGAIESWFQEAGPKANNPEFEQRAAEIRELLKQKPNL